MTNHATPDAGANAALRGGPVLAELDLTPQGLADAPASQQDPDSIVYIGITD